MNYIDTNVIVRAMINNDNDITAQAKKLLSQIISQEDQVYISSPVVMQVLYVVCSKKLYNYPRDLAVKALDILGQLNNICYEETDIIADALHIYTLESALEFVDCYLRAKQKQSKGLVYTLDKKLSKKIHS